MTSGDMNRADYEAAIYQWIMGRNAERDRYLLSLYLLDGLSYRQMQTRLVAMGYDELTEDRLKKIIRKRKAQLFSHI